jgi:Mor family transcriptional regulator
MSLLELIPEGFHCVVKATSEETAIQLVHHFGGSELYIPMRPKEMHPIVQAIGMDATKKLADNYGGAYLRIPVCRVLKHNIRNRQIRAASKRGLRARDIAKKFNLSKRRVLEIIAEA